jgi:hypothetical protein
VTGFIGTFSQLQLIITAHTFNSFWMPYEEPLWRISLLSEARTGLYSPLSLYSSWIHESTAFYNFHVARTKDTTLNSSPLALLVVTGVLCLATCSLLYVVAGTWFPSRCSTMDVWLWVHYSGFQPSRHNIVACSTVAMQRSREETCVAW